MRVLIMDGDHVFLGDLGAALCKAEFTVVATTDEAAGRRHLARSDFDVVVSDLSLSGLSGPELLRITERLRPSPRVVLTCDGPSKIDGSCCKSADVILKKPVDARTFLEAIQRAALGSCSGNSPTNHPDRSVAPNSQDEKLALDDDTRILVVEDEFSIRDFLGILLPNFGFHPTLCASADHALDVVRESTFDIVLSDICMPGTDGLKFCEILRESHPDLPFVLMTGQPTTATMSRAEELSVAAFLTKPVRNLELIAVLEKAVSIGRIAAFKRRAIEANTQVDLRRVPPCLYQTEDLTDALSSFYLAYQPIMAVEEKSPVLVGVEALIRSDHEVLNCPERLLGAAEHFERLIELGRLVRECAAMEVANRSDDCLLFLNLHPLELFDDGLVSSTQPLTRIAHRVVFELTERAVFDGMKSEVRGRLERLRDLGFRIAIDDLGTGRSALESFVVLEPDFVKLDRVMVAEIDELPHKQELVASVIELCRSMDIVVVAEGVETEKEYRTLQTLGCQLAQGFWLSKPARSRSVSLS